MAFPTPIPTVSRVGTGPFLERSYRELLQFTGQKEMIRARSAGAGDDEGRQGRESKQLTTAHAMRILVCNRSDKLAVLALYEVLGSRYGRGVSNVACCFAANKTETSDKWQKPHCYSPVGRWILCNRRAEGLDC